MNAQTLILLVEDDEHVSATVSTALEREGWTSRTAGGLAEAQGLLTALRPQVVIVDLSLPDGSGLALVREAGRLGCGVIIASGRGDEVDRVVGLEVGADDYLAKPFSVRELAARVRALLRRMAARPEPAGETKPLPTQPSWNFGGVTLDPARPRITGPDGAEVRLTGSEAGMLQLLLDACPEPVSRPTISERVLGHKLLPEQRGVDQLASMLRRKLLDCSGGALHLIAVRGRGYRLVT
ncbi:MAG: response regulator transcription factor [Acetobacteraceae bacterium]|nr:response regulator transcription factor [Acetobacteraceae bacterium]